MSLSDRLAQARKGREFEIATPDVDEAAPQRSTRKRSVDPYADIKKSVHAALVESLGPQLYQTQLSEADLSQRVRVVLHDVLADTAPSLDERSITIMENSDKVFLLTTLDIPSLKNLKIALETLRLVNFPIDRLRVVMNRADSKVGLDAKEVEKTLGVPVIGFIPSSRLVPAATNRGVAIVADQPKHAVSIAINRLISQEITLDTPPPEKRGGFLGLRREA